MKKQLIFALVFSFIIFGLSFADFAQALGEPIPGIDIVVKPNPIKDGIAITDQTDADSSSITITPSDLGVDNVGILPTSRFYFLKKWGRGIERLFAFSSVEKAQVELKIANKIAAETLVLEEKSPNNTESLKKTLENYTKAQERLNEQLGKLSEKSENPNVAELLKKVDEKTAKHVALFNQITQNHNEDGGQNKKGVRKAGKENQEYVEIFNEALGNTLKTFTVAVTPVNDEPAMKLKAEEQIKSAGVAIEESNSALLQVSTTRGIKWDPALGTVSYIKVTVPKQTQGSTFGEKMKTDSSSNDELSIFDRWGNMIVKAKGNLDSAKKAFAEGKYGEAYGQARSAEAMVPVLATDSNFPDKKVDTSAKTKDDKSKNKDSDKSSESTIKINKDESSEPTERESDEEDKTSIELKSSTTVSGSTGSATQ